MKIKPCPHCGGTACLNKSYSNRTHSYYTFVRCDICGAQGKTYGNKEDPAAADWNNQACRDAIGAWNMRTGAADAAED